MNHTSTMVILGDSGTSRQRYDNFKPFKTFLVDCGRGLNRSSTVTESGSFLVVPWVESWPFLNVQGESE